MTLPTEDRKTKRDKSTPFLSTRLHALEEKHHRDTESAHEDKELLSRALENGMINPLRPEKGKWHDEARREGGGGEEEKPTHGLSSVPLPVRLDMLKR